MNKLVEVCEEKKIIHFGKQFALKNIFPLNLNGFNGSYHHVKNNLIMSNVHFRAHIPVQTVWRIETIDFKILF